ncbi:transporter substrate-binding domain-containing protein [Nocardioides sp.]|uniref:transporter substrate-binding domain-containing protein n=1 Tax=Nocardioides sp. TaxID=35761 RepID=UPI0026378627|nr:transporter substrate-binding domain-containing protein [Nocardioides sp.]
MQRRWWHSVLAIPVALALTACGGGEATSSSTGSSSTADRGSVTALDGLTGYAQQLASTGRVRIGVSYQTPGLGYLAPGSSAPTGFEVEVGKIIAGGLGISADKIQWIQVLDSGRDQALTTNAVDMVISSLAMTRSEEQQVGMAGPYYITGTQLLVRAADQAAINAATPGPNGNPRLRRMPISSGQKVCAVSGSTTASTLVHEFKQQPVLKAAYGDCVGLLQQGTVAAVAGDGAIGMGYAHSSAGALVVAGDPFTEEKYGVAFPKGMTGMCDFVQRTLLRGYKDGSWLEAFDDTLGQSGVESPPEPPAFEPC